MALTYTRALLNPVAAQTINSAATYTSSELDIGDATIATQIWLYLSVTGFASAPTGTMRITVAPVHTTAGNAFDDFGVSWDFTVAADQLYEFPLPLGSLPRFFKVLVLNNTDVNTDATSVNAWIELVKVTA